MAQKKMTYKEAYSKLEEILTQIESDELDVDELGAKVKSASELIKFCKAKLYETEAQVEKILDNMDED